MKGQKPTDSWNQIGNWSWMIDWNWLEREWIETHISKPQDCQFYKEAIWRKCQMDVQWGEIGVGEQIRADICLLQSRERVNWAAREIGATALQQYLRLCQKSFFQSTSWMCTVLSLNKVWLGWKQCKQNPLHSLHSCQNCTSAFTHVLLWWFNGQAQCTPTATTLKSQLCIAV